MLTITRKRSLATLAAMAGLLAVAGPAGAQGGGADFTRFYGASSCTRMARADCCASGFTAPLRSSVGDLLGATGPKATCAAVSDGTSNTVMVG
jgi:hypothetical protein